MYDDNLLTNDKSSCDIDPSGSWITLDTERLVWLPPEYRLLGNEYHESYWDVRHSCIAMSTKSQPLFILKLCCSMCPQQATVKSRTIKTECTPAALERRNYTYTCKPDDSFFIVSFNMNPSDNNMTEVIND